MARNEPQVNLRIPEALKSGLDAAAIKNKRSLTAEIVARLQASFEPDSSNLTTADITKLFDAHHDRLLATLQEAVAAAKAPPPTTEN